MNSNREATSSKFTFVRQLLFWPSLVFVLLYFTHSLWIPLLVPLAMQRARHAGTTESESRREWEFARQRATEAKNLGLLKTVASDTSAPGEIRGKAWVALAEQYAQSADPVKAGENYLSALDCLISDSKLSGEGYGLRDKVWDELRFHLGATIDPQRYRTVLTAWAERTEDQRLLQQLLFELGKMKLLAKAEPVNSAEVVKP